MVRLKPTQLEGDCTLYAPPVSYWQKIVPQIQHHRSMLDRQVMPFGKCRGWCIHEVVSGEAKYARWLMAQDWFRTKYAAHYQYFTERLISGDGADGPSAA